MTDPEIARALGVSSSTITKWRNRAGLRRVNKRQNKFSAEPLKPIRKSDAPSQEELAYYKGWLRDWAGVS